MEDVLRWQHDIGIVFDNHAGCQYFLAEMIATSHDAYDLATKIQEFYEESIDCVLRDVPQDSSGHWFVNEMCNNLPRYVFEMLARQYWAYRK